MGKIYSLTCKICLGLFVIMNCFACIITTDFRVIIPLNLLVAGICLGIILFMESRFSGLAAELGISKNDARALVGAYFVYYKNVDRISIDDYLEIYSNSGEKS